jgi:CHAT domain-containing protein
VRAIVLLLFPAIALAQEEAAVAEKVRSAVAAGDEAAVRRLAAAGDPDRWLVVDALCARGEIAAAAAFAAAAAAASEQESKLPAYVASRPKVDDGGAHRAAFAQALAAFEARRERDCLAALERIQRQTDDVLRVNVAFARGIVLENLKDARAAGVAFVDAAEAAERIGWVNCAAQAWEKAGLDAHFERDLRLARGRWERQRAIEEARRDPPRTAVVLARLGMCNWSLGEGREGLALSERALAGAEACGAEGDATWIARNVGMIRAGLGETAAAVGAYEKAVALGRKTGNRREEAAALNGLGGCALTLGDPDRALSCHEEAAKIAEAIEDRPMLAASLASAVNVHMQLADYAAARELSERALALYIEVGDEIRQANVWMGLAGIRRHTGDLRGAQEAYEECRRRAEAAGERRLLAKCLYGQATVAYDLGDFNTALRHVEESVRLQEAAGGSAELCRALSLIGDLHSRLGELQKGISYFERARAEAARAGDVLGEAVTIGAMGTAYYNWGYIAKSLSLYEQAAACAEGLDAPVFQADELRNMGSALARVGDLPRALSFLQRALSIAEKTDDRLLTSFVLFDSARAHAALGQHDEALGLYGRVIEAAERVGDRNGCAQAHSFMAEELKGHGDYAAAADHYDQARQAYEATGNAYGAAECLSDLADVRRLTGDIEGASELSERGLAAARAAGAGERLVGCLRVAARVRLAAGRPREAVAAAREAVGLVPAWVEQLSEAEGAYARSEFADVFETGILAGQALADAGEILFFLESGRAGTLIESLAARDTLRTAVLPQELLGAEVVARAREAAAAKEYARAVAEGSVTGTRDAQSVLAERQAAHADVIQRIQRDAKAAASVIYPRADSLTTVQGRLDEGEALVVYALCRELSLALVVTRRDARIVSLGRTREVEDACAALCADSPGDTTGPAERLRVRVVEPLKLDRATKLLVSPDGALSYVPFALLCGDRDVAYVPSGTAYGLLVEDAALRGTGVLALGDPDYGTKPDASAVALLRSGRALVRLPATADEARAVGTTVLLGKDATEAGLRRALAQNPRWRAVHFACHGILDAERPLRSSLALTAADDDDGFLTALDVFRLRMPADLVVLSACETGKGKVFRAEGIVGLTRAFMVAGAPRVLVSLWRVDDAATRALMARFHAAWNAGKPAAAALREAQAHVRSKEEWKHPRFWAAWVLWGLPE